MGAFFVGVDAGTQSTKAVVWDLAGRQVALGRAPLAVSTPAPGWAEQYPDDWWASVCQAMRGALEELARQGESPDDIAAVGLAWQRETFVPLDAQGRPLCPAILWLDQRATREAHLAGQALGQERFLALTGKQLDTTPAFSKLCWMRAHEPDLYVAMDAIRDVGSYLAERLTGRACSALAGADSLCLIDLAAGAWSLELLAYLGLDPTCLPEVVPAGAVIGQVTARAAEETGLPAGTPVVLAGGDGQVFAVGVNARDESSLSLTVGTSLVLGVHWPAYRVGPSYRTMAGCYPGTFLLEAVLRAGADILRWFVRDFGQVESEYQMEELAAAIPPGSQGLLTVPYWKGRMVPTNDPLARGVTLGWSDYTTQAHFYRSVLEGIAFEVRLMVDAYRQELGICPAQIHLGGGGALSSLWRGIMADVTGLEVELSAVESTALGAAMMAATAIGTFPGLTEASEAMYRPTARVAPDGARGALYDGLYEGHYKQLYGLLRPTLVALGKMALEGDG